MNTKTSETVKLPESKLVKNQKKQFRVDTQSEQGEDMVIIAEVRHDDECGNGHNSFSITADIYLPHRQPYEPKVTHQGTGKTLWLNACGCCHDEVRKHFPELAPLLKWHMTSTDGPTHYLANVVYLAGDRDYRGMRKGEKKQLVNGRTNKPTWERVMRDSKGNVVSYNGLTNWVDADEKPAEQLTASWEPVWIEGEGKARELNHARSSAVWPEATDEQLSVEPEELKRVLIARLPALMAEFKQAVESLGFTY